MGASNSRIGARRLFRQMTVPEVDAIEGLPTAVALQQQRGSAKAHQARCCISIFAFPISSSEASSMPAMWFLAFLVAIISSSNFS